jgi:hypothetical protein
MKVTKPSDKPYMTMERAEEIMITLQLGLDYPPEISNSDIAHAKLLLASREAK